MQALAIITLLLSTLIFSHAASADGLSHFDFNDVPVSQKKKTDSAAQVESYMENIYGAEVRLGPGVRATNNARGRTIGMHLGNSDTSPLGVLVPAAELPDTFLMSGKGKTPSIVITFGEVPIHSFAVDWQLFRKARGLTIKADGKVIFEQALIKAETKVGMLGHQDPIFFDDPVHTQEFIGWKKSKFGIDNLVVNFPLGGDGDFADGPEGPSGTGPLEISGDVLPEPTLTGFIPPTTIVADTGAGLASIPEPATFLLLSLGLLLIFILRYLAPRMKPAQGKSNRVRAKCLNA